MRDDYDDLVMHNLAKTNSHPLLRTAAAHIKRRTEAMSFDQLALDQFLKITYEESLQDLSGDALQRQVLAYVASEINIFNAFDVARKQAGAASLPEQISTHKMGLILNRVHAEFAHDESAVVNLFANHFSPEPSFHAQWPALRTNTYWGSTRGVMYSAKQLCAHFATSDDTCADLIHSSIVHATPWATLTPTFATSGSKFAITVAGVPAFGFVHGGYAFGGQRQEPRHEQFGPEDCSSILSNWLYQAQDRRRTDPAPIQFSTVHQLYYWRSQVSDTLMIDREVYNTDMHTLFNANFSSALKPAQQPGAIETGDVYLLRTFAKAAGNPDSHGNGGGHTGVVIDRDHDEPGKVLIFECARDMELENPEQNIWGPAGCGVGSFSTEYEQDYDLRVKRTMFLRPRV